MKSSNAVDIAAPNRLPPDCRTPRKRKTRRGKKLSRAKARDIYLNEVSDILGSIADKMTCFQTENESMDKTGDDTSNAECCFAPHSVATHSHRGRRFLRPAYSPNAPHNTTQFLMEVHADDFHLPFDCEVAGARSSSDIDAYHNTSGCSALASSYKELPAYSDIDFEYESPDDLDQQAFFERDFEMVFRDEREHELLSRSKTQLIKDILGLRDYIDTVESVLHASALVQMPASVQLAGEVSNGFEEGSSGHFSKLVSELQELKRQNEALRAENKLLALKPHTENMQRRVCEM